jgi:hypothetical protein
MTSNEKIVAILRRLLEKTHAGQVNWQRTQTGNGGNLNEEVYVRFPASVIHLARIRPPTEPDYILVRVCRADGFEVGQLRASEYDDPNWQLFFELHEEAKRFAGGWDKVWNDIAEAVGREGSIGLPPGR